MSDNQHWQAPGGTQPPPPVGPPSADPGPGAYYAPPPVAPTAQGWTPPPKPGLVPLRPMTLGTILGASFQVMRRNPRATIVPGLLTALLLAIAVSIGVVLIFGALGRISTTTNAQDAGALAAGTFAIALLVLVAGGALSVVAAALLQAIIVTEVARGTVGEKLRLGQIWTAARGRFGAMIGYTVLLVVAIVLGFALFYALILAVTFATVSASTSSASSVTGAIFATLGVMLLGFLCGAALFLWLSTKLAFVPAAIVLERMPVGRAIARSWTLTRGYFWRTLGILLLVEVMVWIATQIVAVPLQLVLSLGTTLLYPTGADAVDPGAIGAGAAVALIVSYAVVSIVSAIGMVLISATSSLLYLDLRMRKEGLDLELARFVEARQTGADVADPYLRG